MLDTLVSRLLVARTTGHAPPVETEESDRAGYSIATGER